MSERYDLVHRIVKNSKLNADEIKLEIIKKIEEKNLAYDYDQVVIGYLREAGKRRDDNAKRIFKNVFQDDLKKLGYFFLVGMAMHLEGLYDLINVWATVKEGDKISLDISQSPHYRFLYQNAILDIPLMIVGETGTSKELLARTIHLLSNRGEGTFSEINCAAITESLFESELFGVIANYPGFHNPNPLVGKIELSDKGTFFLDEIGKMPKSMQAKLLKAIEDKKITPLGEDKPVEVNVRFIAAAQPGELKRIIPDLRYRLGYPNVIPTTTVKERMALIGADVIKFSFENVLRKLNMKKEEMDIEDDVYDTLLNRNYIGNYRELESILTGMTISALSGDRDKISMSDYLLIMDNINRCERKQKDSAPGEKGIITCRQPLSKVPLKDILDYSERVQKEIIETKIIETLKSGRDIKNVLLSEGLPAGEYVNFIYRFERKTGKGIRDYKRGLNNSSL